MLLYRSLLHISTFVSTPTEITSFVIPAYSRRFAGIRILPCLSTSASVAPAKKKRMNLQAQSGKIHSEYGFSLHYHF